MNICKWCNSQVSDEKTVWYRRNLVLGYSFCSTKCATQWKQSNNESNSSDLKSPETSIEDLKMQKEEKRLIREQQDQENIEAAQKIMAIVGKLSQHWKIVVPLYVIAFAALVLMLDQKHTIVIVIAFSLPIIAVIWAYFTVPKS
jgi:hypothetical protein